MVDAIEQASVRKGFDPREFVLVAEGGGGPLFAPEIAPEVGVKNVLVPSYPGITAALGLLTTDMVYEYAATSYAMASALYGTPRPARRSPSSSRSSRPRRARSSSTTASTRKKVRSSTSPRRATRARATSCASTSAPGAIDAAWIDAMKAAFHDIHEREYSRRFEDADVQIANVRVRAVGLMPGLDAPQVKKGKAAPPDGRAQAHGRRLVPRQRQAQEGQDGVLRAHRAASPATSSRGPRSSPSSTRRRVVPPGFSCKVDPVGNLVVTYSKAVQQAAERGH